MVPTKADCRRPVIAYIKWADLSDHFRETKRLIKIGGEDNPVWVTAMGHGGTVEMRNPIEHLKEVLRYRKDFKYAAVVDGEAVCYLSKNGEPKHIRKLEFQVIDPYFYNHLVATLDFTDTYAVN